MAERDEQARDPEWTDLTDPADAVEPEQGMPEMKPIPPEMYKGPGGCGFTGCMYAVMIVAALMLALLIIGLLTREWIVPVVPRGG
ncbi:hypothetical protein [Longimicrobium sp.]|uniref:hypothetical protein n=1 Tax=Longimicrobium sp. TaxID=2029185 RepID=UPI002E35B7E5|nr:hypothetical protein [Longimicrobium sp.]HEX6042175.1 hypothetical protein [Longimicrobium sp.]